MLDDMFQRGTLFFKLRLDSALLHCRVHRVNHLFTLQEAKGFLYEIIIGAGVEGFPGDFFTPLPCVEDDRYGWRDFPDIPEHLEAVSAGENIIKHDDINCIPGQCFENALAGGVRGNVEFLAVGSPEKSLEHGIVFYMKHPDFSHDLSLHREIFLPVW